MPVTFLKQPTSFGNSFAQGAAHSLQRLAAGRLQQIETQNERSDFAKKFKAAYPGASEQEAAYLAHYAPEQRLKALSDFQFGGSAPQQERSTQVQEEPTIYSAAQKQREQELSPEQAELTKGDVNELLKEHQLNQLGENLQIPKGNDLANFAKSLGYEVTPEKRKQFQQKLDAFKDNPELLQQAKQRYDQGVANNETVELRKPGYTGQATPYDQAIQQPRGIPVKKLTQAEKIAQQKLEFNKSESALKREDEAWKYQQDYIDKVDEAADAAEETKRDVEMQRNLDKSGKLDKAGYVEMLNRAGLDIPALLSPESQAFKKIAQNYQKNLKNLYGGSISNFQVDQLMEAVPTLSLSEKGRELLYPVLDNISDDTITRQLIKNKIIQSNGNVPPRDLHAQVSKSLKPLLKQSASQLQKQLVAIQKMQEQIKDKEEPIETAILAGIGDLVGIAKRAGPAALGTAAGWYFAGPTGGFFGGQLAQQAANAVSNEPEKGAKSKLFTPIPDYEVRGFK